MDDLESLLALYKHLNPEDDPAPSSEIVKDVWSDLISSNHFTYYGGFVDSDLISSCTLAAIPNLTRACSSYGLIENVVTHEEHRRRGYATTLLASVLEDAWTAGCYKVMLLTGHKDTGTRQFYEQAGFDSQAKVAFEARPSKSQ